MLVQEAGGHGRGGRGVLLIPLPAKGPPLPAEGGPDLPEEDLGLPAHLKEKLPGTAGPGEKSGQKVPGPHLSVAQAAAFLYGILQDPAEVGGEGPCQGEGRPRPQGPDEGLPDGNQGEALAGQELTGPRPGMAEEAQEKVFAAHMVVAQALGEGPGRGQPGPGQGGEGHGLDGDPSSRAVVWVRGSEMTDLCRFSWVRVEGAPSRLGVMLPRTSWVRLASDMVLDHLSG